MIKIVAIVPLTLVACILAGIYGILHDQLTYTISKEYYTKFKFYQFGLLDEGMPGPLPNPRLWVCYVGFMATWWLGLPIGIILGSISMHRDIKTMVDIALKSFLIVLAIAFLTSLYGLCEGHFYTSNLPKENFRRWFIPDNLVDYKSFITVGTMHNHSYLGGLCGLVGGVAYVGWRKGLLQLRKNAQSSRRH